MDRLAKIEKDELIRRMRHDFEAAMAQITDAVNDASDGHLIDESEERCRDVLGEFRRRAYETVLQMRVDATEASPAFSPGEPGAGPLRGTGGPLDADVQRQGGGASPPLSKRRGVQRDAGG